jgi:guanyl-specific ribonuclease Sa
MTFSPLAWAMISAATVRPSVDAGRRPRPASRTSPSDGVARLAGQLLDDDLVSGGDAILLAARAHDCEHGSSSPAPAAPTAPSPTARCPIDVISAEALSQSGFTEVNRLLNQQVPSFNFPQPSITDGTDVIRPATLRGLRPTRRWC